MPSNASLQGIESADLPENLSSIVSHALGDWFPSAKLSVSSLAPGLSGAALLRADISGPGVADDVAGVYVLKVAEGQGTARGELSGEERAANANADFAERHVPRLVRLWNGTTADGASGSARLLDLAGGSLRRYTVASRRGSAPLLSCAEEVVSSLLRAWARPADLRDLSPADLLEEGLGAEKASEAIALADDFYAPSGIRYEHGHIFLSPSWLMRGVTKFPHVCAFQHGDLHTGNIILPIEPQAGGDDFWVIDFDLASDGLLGMDVAYLELSLICDFYDNITNSSLARCLDGAESPQRNLQVPDDLQWLAGFMRAARDATLAYAATLAGRADDIERQVILGRVVEALRWARRHPGRRKSHLALIYAGWYAAHYERMFPESLGDFPDASTPVSPGGGVDPAGLKPAEQEIWDRFWHDTGRLAKPDCTYVLVAERVGPVDGLGALGRLPWSAIVDLDPTSDHDGLYSQAGPVLATSRAVHVYSEELPAADEKRGTIWLMSAGWRLRREPHLDFRQWFRSRFRNVRTLFEALRRRAGDQQVIVVALVGKRAAKDAESGEDRLVRIMEACDEAWEGRASIMVVGEAELRTAVPTTFYPLEASVFVRQVATIFGAEEGTTEYRLPAGDGDTVVLHQDTLQVLREHFEVLHDHVVLTSAQDEQANDAFWRGGQILWSDLSEELDVARSVGPDLRRALTESLQNHRTQTVVLQHRPGAGGTTAALRAAWDLHHSYPVAIMRPGQPMTPESVRLLADRLHRLFVLTDSPVLLVADSADLPEAYRETLYRELAARNARITLLYVRRSLSPNSEQLCVSHPLDLAEARLFLSRYRQLTTEPARIAELEMLASDAYERYRTPFFYGLITYQRGFTKLGDYVDHHIRDVAGRARDVLAHLALVTLYCNSGLQLGLLQRLFRVSGAGSALSIDDLLGAASALVVQRGGRYRVAHQLIAEELLGRLTGVSSDWRLHLNDLALDFIEDLSGAADTTAEPLRLLFRQVFIDRVSGVTEGVEDRGVFAPIIEELDAIDPSIGHQVLVSLTEHIADEPHFWNHLGRHQIYRLQRDLDLAERYLETAVDLSPDDAVHHHTLGLARRARMRQGLRTAEGQGTEPVMAVIEAWFYRTVECFERARTLSPDNIYGYITHVQSLLDAARALRTAARVETVAHIPSVAGEWVVEQLTIANGLLDDASQLYGTLDRQDDYLQKCLADIQRLYGDLDGVVRLWEVDQAGGKSTPFSRRALAQAYLVRAKRSWRALAPPELRRIASLAEDNLRRSGARDEDYRLWFEAHKLMPDFEIEQALAHLELWSARLPSWRAAFYRYVLHFLLWFSERTDDIHAIDTAQEQCTKLIPGRKNHSHSWLGKDPGWCPLVADSDLGEWDRRKRFWNDTSLLQRVNGVIDFIDGPASGLIMIGDSRVQAFFVPASGAGYMADADENAPVNFFLGFSASGLRAWDVQRGTSDDALTRRGDVGSLATFVTRPRASDYEQVQQARAAALKLSRVKELTQAFAEAALARGGEVRLDWLEERVMAALGVGSLERLHGGTLNRVVMGLPEVRLVGTGQEAVLRRRAAITEVRAKDPEDLEVGFVSHVDRSAGWGVITRAEGGTLRFSTEDVDNMATADLRRNCVVRFRPSQERRNERALRVEVLGADDSLFNGEVVAAADLAPLVKAETRRHLEALLAEDRADVPASEIEDHLERTFRAGLPLARRLDLTGLRAFLRAQPWLSVRGQAGAQVVSLRATFGQEHADSPAGGEEAQSAPRADRGAAPGVDPREAVRRVFSALEPTQNEITLQAFGPRLKEEMGEEAYARFVGTKRLMRALQDLDEWMIEHVRPGITVIARRQTLDAIRQPAVGRSARGEGAALRKVFSELEREHDEITLHMLAARLKQEMGEKRYARFIGKKGLKRALQDFNDEWSVEPLRPGVDVIKRRQSGRDARGTEPREAIRQVFSELERKYDNISLQLLGLRFKAVIGPEAYARFVGDKGLMRAVQELDEWTLEHERPGLVFITRREGTSSP